MSSARYARQFMRLLSPATAPHPTASPSAAATWTSLQCRGFQTTSPLSVARRINSKTNPKLRTTDRGPQSKEETQTDFGAMDVLSNTPAPATGIDVCTSDGFALNNNTRVTGSGVLLVDGECFAWRPWAITNGGNDVMPAKLKNAKGQWEVDKAAWGVLDLLWPKPDLLILGTGPSMAPLSPTTRKHINDLGIRVEIQDTRNAAAQFNLLATERGVQQVAAALVPLGWKEAK